MKKTWKARALTAERLKRRHYKNSRRWQDKYWDIKDEWEAQEKRLRAQLSEVSAQRDHWQAMLGAEIDEDRIISGWTGPVMDAVTGKAYGAPGEFIQAVRNRRAVAAAGGVDVLPLELCLCGRLIRRD